MKNVQRTSGNNAAQGRLLHSSIICAALLGIGCSNNTQPGDIVAPVVTMRASLQEVPAPLARKLVVATDEPTRVNITLFDGNTKTEAKFEPFATFHELPVLGLKFDTSYIVSVTVTDAAGNQTDAGQFPIPPIAAPVMFPPIAKNVTGAPGAEPGVLLFTAASQHLSATVHSAYVIVVDENGDVIWYFDAGTEVSAVQRLANGHLVLQSIPEHHTSMTEIDMLGQTVRTWITRKSAHDNNPSAEAIKVDIDTFHHDLTIMPNGNFLTMSTDLRYVQDFPTEETNVMQTFAPAHFVNSILVEFEPASGKVVRRWTLIDGDHDFITMNPPLDYKRMGYQSLRNRFWAPIYGVGVGGDSTDCGANGIDPVTGAGTCYDRDHANAFWYDASTDSIVFAVRHNAAIVNFQAATGATNWILGNHAYWSPKLKPYLLEPPASATASFWPYYAHRVTMTKARTILMLDNHNFEALPPDAPLAPVHNNTRVAEYEVKDGAVKSIWEYEYPVVPGDELNTNLYVPAVGSALEMPETGNILIDFGGICKVPDATLRSPMELGNPGEPTNDNRNCKVWARIIEVTHDDAKKVVFDIRVGNNDIADPLVWFTYRATKLRSLYP